MTVTMVSDETMAPNKETHFGLISLRQMEKHYHQLVTFVGRDGQTLSSKHNCWPRSTSTITSRLESQLLTEMDKHYHLVTIVGQDGQALSACTITESQLLVKMGRHYQLVIYRVPQKKLPFVKMGRGKYYC